MLGKEVTQASDIELLTVILGRRHTAETLLKQAGSLFALLFETRHNNGDLFCAQGSSAYAADAVLKLHAACELAARAIAEDLRGRDCLLLRDVPTTRPRHGGCSGVVFLDNLVIKLASPTGFEPVLPP